MPLYEYYCNQCQTIFEVIRPISNADEPIQCINCFNTKVKRKLSKIALSMREGPSSGSSSSCSGCTSHSCSNCH